MPKQKILVKFPSRSRPQKFFAGLENIISTVYDLKNLKILVSLDKDDATMYNKEVLTQLRPYLKDRIVTVVYSTSKSKIDAVNRDMEHAKDWDILVVYSDDMQFLQHGWDETIREKFDIHFPDTLGNLHFYDGFQPRVSTMTIMGNAYYKLIGENIYEPCYKSTHCDEEYTFVGNKLGLMQYFPEVICRHNHAINTGGPIDDQLRFTESQSEEDRQTFTHRMNSGIVAELIEKLRTKLPKQLHV